MAWGAAETSYLKASKVGCALFAFLKQSVFLLLFALQSNAAQ